MGNMHCPAEDAARVASVARGIGPFPNYNPSPHLINIVTTNSTLQLRDHYTAVQTSLTLKQLEDFTQGLRTTFGRESRVTLGGFGVVALSLAGLFDTLAKQVRGESVSDSGPIPGLFLKDLRGYYPPHVDTISEYLRLVPHIANNPSRMREETERYINQLTADDQALDNLGENHTLPLNEDVTIINMMMGNTLKLHLLRITNGTIDKLNITDMKEISEIIINFNCDPEAADKDFLAAVQKSDNRTQEAFKDCKPNIELESKTWLQHAAKLEFIDGMFLLFYAFLNVKKIIYCTRR